MEAKSLSAQKQSFDQEEGQALTQEQLSDVYFAGTSDGAVHLADETVIIPNTGYEDTEQD